jgi:hypothetical protein
MRAKEFIFEQKLSDVHDGLDVASKALPNTFVIPELKNQDFYDLYRFGVAIADVRGDQADNNPLNKNLDPYKPKFRAESEWGENQIVSSFDPNVGKVIDQALAKVNKSGKKAVSTPSSDEMDDTQIQSIMKPFKGYPK